MKRISTILALIVLFAAMPAQVFAQGKYEVKGVVVDEIGPVVGATVLETGTTNGTMTDIDGAFALNVSSKDAVVEISCIGYTTVSFKASEVPARITLAEDAQFLDEVVVIGYGTVKKSDMTGSLSAVKADQLNKGNISSPADLLMGKSAGVVVTPSDGAPGSAATIRIRGCSSLKAATVLSSSWTACPFQRSASAAWATPSHRSTPTTSRASLSSRTHPRLQSSVPVHPTVSS